MFPPLSVSLQRILTTSLLYNLYYHYHQLIALSYREVVYCRWSFFLPLGHSNDSDTSPHGFSSPTSSIGDSVVSEASNKIDRFTLDYFMISFCLLLTVLLVMNTFDFSFLPDANEDEGREENQATIFRVSLVHV